ncbi:MAG TPA: conjugal transfer protein TraF [Cellvibrionaceae bacterium]|nr:conjugal transfer protein TraF [Cellvibrionaceae bacterium]HMW47166.1 conjugal transfer protein TraF [Cellvibrionaceae bacterium]HMY38626.1 conjugal transfer protein TraF [Marinagarivorans sp.]HNG59384.1 conjugal transfer protein TraF [Cellvibrionaceae bacterium]
MRHLAPLTASLIALPALAQGLASGPTLTTGQTSDHHSVYAGALNPALGELMVNEGEQFRLGFTPSISTITEVGQVDNFVDDLDDLIDLIDDPSLNKDPVQTVLDRFNNILVKMGDEGYVKNSAELHLPLLPVYWKMPLWDGTLMADISLNTQVLARVLDAPLSYDEQNKSFSTATAAYLKGATQTAFALGYARGWFDTAEQKTYGGQLYAGAKLSVYAIELSKQVFLLQKLDGKDIGDVIRDEYDNNSQSTTAAGLDLGVIWASERYRLGATLYNLNQPSFDYGPIGENCQTRAENSVARANCEAAADFAQVRGEIKALESHKKSAYLAVDGTYYWQSNAWVSAALDLASYDDFVGTQNQWLNISGTYSPSTHWLPTVRSGLQKNLAGSKLTQLALGLEFKGVSLDVSWALDSTAIDGSDLPRSFGFSLAIAEQF